MVDMFNNDDLVLDCRTCRAANTTACNECVVTHLFANDAGPIEFVPTPVSLRPSQTDQAVELFAKAGMLDDTPEFVAYSTFESSEVPQLVR
ncbi:MAG: hypothetical protein ACJAR2_001422 [Ilumatobacter sp.]|jgi:hypothetical protein